MVEAAPPLAIAFVDVDNTLMRGASLYYVAVGAWRHHLISARDILSFGWKQARFLAVGENRDHVASVRERGLELVRGHNRAELIRFSQEIFEARLAPRLWPEMVAAAREHLTAGREVWLISATAQELADVIAERLGFTGALGTILEAVDGVFTGRLIDGICHGDLKAQAAARRAAASGVDLARCWAYSDSHNDIPLLELVGHPVVVNPDAALRRHAASQHWPIMRLKPASIKAAGRRAGKEIRASKKR
ncbi:MAG TPA: HAD-IB family hydrolase [Cryobacterium sp.]|nr:HAD-IB family hydrolase [Cryobacterium sp.]